MWHPSRGSETAFEVNHRGDQVRLIRRRAGQPAQETNMIRNFADQVFSGKLNDEWPMWALKTQQVMDACFESARRNSPVKLESKL